MNDDELFRYFSAACDGFRERLALVRPGQWGDPTPCSEWDVRRLVNHMVRGNLNYALLARGGSGAEFLRLRDADALGDDPAGAFDTSVARCLRDFQAPGALDRVADYPMGPLPGRRLLAVRLADSVVHTWDLARAAGLDERLDDVLVGWVWENLDRIYDGVNGGPLGSDRRFFAAPSGTARDSTQGRLLHLMGRSDV